jgi:hypothetical protein
MEQLTAILGYIEPMDHADDARRRSYIPEV